MPLDGLPPEIAGLARGHRPQRGSWPITSASTRPRVPADLVPRNSSLFGLITYADDRTLAAVGFDFTVRSLKVRFANSVIASFRSRIALALNELFAAKVTRQQAPDNVHGARRRLPEARRQRHVRVLRDRARRRSPPRTTCWEAWASPRPPSRPRHSVGRRADRHRRDRLLLLGHDRVPGARHGQPRRPVPSPLDLFSYDSLVYRDLELQHELQPVVARRFASSPSIPATSASTSAPAGPRPTGFATHFPVTADGDAGRGRHPDARRPRHPARRHRPGHRRRSARPGSRSSTTSTWAAWARWPARPGSSPASWSPGPPGPARPRRVRRPEAARLHRAPGTRSPSRASSRSPCSPYS